MEVYIVMGTYFNGESEIMGVFSTFEKAKTYYNEHLKNDKNYSFSIEKWEIDTDEQRVYVYLWGDEML